ncbi:hypothetical protein CABS01_12696, partial [Colletotrichum abscissum]|uniref:uncharacterized protein n=1 Tax=Colletotrichum abscissum TaxID=1671311 RepID=UPI0027D6E997
IASFVLTRCSTEAGWCHWRGFLIFSWAILQPTLMQWTSQSRPCSSQPSVNFPVSIRSTSAFLCNICSLRTTVERLPVHRQQRCCSGATDTNGHAPVDG